MQSRRMRARYFTPTEANDLLPTVVATVTRAAQIAEHARDNVQRLESGAPMVDEERQDLAREVEDLRDEVRQLLEQIGEHGVEVKGLAPSLLVFPALLRGQEVLLCWKEGDQKVAWWHPGHTGIDGRQPVTNVAEAEWEWCN